MVSGLFKRILKLSFVRYTLATAIDVRQVFRLRVETIL